ncbi:zinc finger CCCH domain-containing protein 32-like isoform X2 [Primulina huaijiensis]|uniref:zinc finger CCCH domain-containing protein 32-like isoform X2 n=1 Tax=Primulina huaijiensis TaxID=1492673 RepID=UPI003CC79BFE
MERYSGIQAMEGVPGESIGEWVAPGGETGLEEPMWQLGLGGGPESYPERPDDPDCIYFLRTGFCGYGNRCRFNHPRDRGVYYMRTGMCKFGASCKYHHPKHGVGSSGPVTLNFYGYPLRLGEKECSYYVKTGHCKFGITCKFHHPQPVGTQVPEQTPGPGALAGPAAVATPAVYTTLQHPVQSSQQYGVISGNWPVARPPILPGSYVPGNYGPLLLPPGVVPVPGWTPYPASISPAGFPSTQPSGSGTVYGITQLSPQATSYTGPYFSVISPAGPSSSSQKEHAFPERPGQPECKYYLRTGDCKFGSTCKYHHPPEWSAQKTSFMLSPMGLPLRPGAPPCLHYAQNGVCKFGPSCKFDHSMRTLSYSPSASSLTDMPVAPYPVGSTNATLAPSSLSSDLRPELLPGFSKDAFSAQMSSMNSSSASVGSMFSKSEHVPQPSVPQSGMNSVSSRVGTSQGGEIRTSR